MPRPLQSVPRPAVRYELTARRFAGSLAAPTRNETQQFDGTRESLSFKAEGLAKQGWSCWLYRVTGESQNTNYECERTWKPERKLKSVPE